MSGTLAAPSAMELGDPADGTMATVHARLSQRWSGPIAAALAERAHLRPGDRVLDVGTGGGAVASQAARWVGGNGGHVVGVDASAAMLAEARAARLGLPNVDFRRMPAEALDLPDATFDVVLSLFAFPHFRDAGAALAEMRRVLRPGGRVVLGLGGRAPIRSLAGLGHGLRRLSRLLAAWTGRALLAPDSLERLLRTPGGSRPATPLVEGELAAMVRTAGFDQVEISWVNHDTRIDSADEFWEIQAAFSAPARAWLAAASPETRLAMRERFLRQCARVQSAGGRLVYPQEALLLSARRAE